MPIPTLTSSLPPSAASLQAPPILSPVHLSSFLASSPAAWAPAGSAPRAQECLRPLMSRATTAGKGQLRVGHAHLPSADGVWLQPGHCEGWSMLSADENFGEFSCQTRTNLFCKLRFFSAAYNVAEFGLVFTGLTKGKSLPPGQPFCQISKPYSKAGECESFPAKHLHVFS